MSAFQVRNQLAARSVLGVAAVVLLGLPSEIAAQRGVGPRTLVIDTLHLRDLDESYVRRAAVELRGVSPASLDKLAVLKLRVVAYGGDMSDLPTLLRFAALPADDGLAGEAFYYAMQGLALRASDPRAENRLRQLVARTTPERARRWTALTLSRVHTDRSRALLNEAFIDDLAEQWRSELTSARSQRP